jgi:hypothetical protein
MENVEKKPSLGRKIYIAAGLFLILVALPAVSWIYLRNGLNWRKEAIAELANYGKIGKATIIWPDGAWEDQLKSKVVVVHVFGENPDLMDANRQVLDTAEKLFNQFGKTNEFRLAMIASGGTAEFRSYFQKMPSAEHATWVWSGGLGSWRTIMENGYESYCLAEDIKPDPVYFALADTSGTIRRFYNALDQKQVDRMVQHIAILLPPAPQ